MTPRLLVRADAGPRVGTGHVMRCLALAQAHRDARGAVTFVTAPGQAPIEARLRDEGCDVASVTGSPGSLEDAAATAALAATCGATWIVVDGYHLDEAFHARLRGGGVRLLALDDGAPRRHVADLVLNQNLHADASDYADRAPHTELLLGVRHALLRREFAPFRDEPPAPVARVARRVLVTLGGSDPDDVTSTLLDALQQADVDALHATVLVGAANPRLAALRARAARTPNVEVLSSVSDVARRLGEVDLAVTSGGTTVWELAFRGVPAIVGAIAPVEERLLAGLRSLGLFEVVGAFADTDATSLAARIGLLSRDAPRRERMRALGRATVDGRGAERVLEAMRHKEAT